MNAYAPNNSSGGFASLTSSLLARKGEALPAVDAVAHEGVDVEMRPLRPATNPNGPSSVSEAAIGKMYPSADRAREQETARMTAEAHGNVKVLHTDGQRRRVVRDEAPKAWTIPPRAQRRLSGPSEAPTGLLARKAVVTLKMPARDLVRLRLAARDLEMSCQAIILDALECYLDANDVPSAEDDEAIMREVERLISKAKAKRAG